ncbi:MAG: DUF4214 domain-containing protein [Sulfurimonas sp.]|nr:DUF4214 domain-containing protein [Sulfurimonas sp.]
MALDSIETARKEIAKIYIAAFNRVPDEGGLQNWMNQYMAGLMTYEQISTDFTRQAEYTAAYPSYLTSSEYITEIYENVFGRTPDAGGLQNWINQIDNTSITGIDRSNVMYEMLQSASATGNTDGVRLTNQATFAVQSVLDDIPTATATAQLANITSDAATVTAATAAVNAAETATETTGTTYTLTTGADAVTGTSANDTINGAISATAAVNTLGVTDVINGGAGTDALNISVEVLAANIAVPAASLTSIETINVRSLINDGTSSHTTSVDASLFAGVTKVTSDRSTELFAVTNLANGATVGVIGNGTVVNNTTSYAYATATAAQTIEISGGTTAGNITATASTGVTAATINTTGTTANIVGTILLDSAGANTVTSLTINAASNLTATMTANDFAATAALTVTGAAASVNLGTTFDGKTIDASGMTVGGLTIAGNANNTSFIGGKGNDVFTTAAYTTATAGMIAAGDGTADVLDLGNVTHLDTATEAGYYTGFEVVRVNGTYNASTLSGINAIQLSGATNTITGLNATQAAAITARADIGATSFALTDSTGTADVLSLTMGTGLLATEATDSTGLTLNGFETLNITTNSGPTAVAADQITVIAAITADKLKTINLNGKSVEITNAATTLSTTINAASLTGNGTVGLTLGGNLVAGSTVTGSAVADAIALGTVGSTYNLGAGNDAITATAVTQLQSGAVYNTIDAGAGTDTLTLTASTATFIDDDFKGLSNLERLVVDADGGAGNVSITTGGWYNSAFATAGANVSVLAANGDAVTFAGGTFTGVQTLAVTTAGDGASTADNVTIQTGSGADIVTVTAAAWVGAAGAAGVMSVTTGAGNDTINITTSDLLAVTGTNAVTVTGGTGADTISLTHTNNTAVNLGNITMVVAAGDSTKAAYDSVTGFKMSDIAGTGGLISDALDFGTSAIHAAVASSAVAGYTTAELTYIINGTTGEVTFAGTSSAALSVSSALDILDSVVTTGKTVFWTTTTDTYVYNADTTNGDSVVKLVGVNADALITTNDDTTDNGIFIA